MSGIDALRAQASAIGAGRQANATAAPEWFRQFQEFQNTPWAPTELPTAKEMEFQNWMKGSQWFSEVKADIAAENGKSPSELADERVLEMILKDSDYDYRGAWLDNAKTERSAHDEGKIHWPSSSSDGKFLKSPNHPTAWKEFFMRNTLKDPDELGIKRVDQAVKWTQMYKGLR